MSTRAMIVVGAGSSTRFGADKLTAEVAGRPLIEHTVAAVIDHVDVCVVVCRPEVGTSIRELHHDVTVTQGGATRTASEMAGLAALGTDVDLIGIHDAARPLVQPETITILFETADAVGGAVPLLGDERLIVDRTTHRPLTGLMRAQTPQVFRGPELLAAYERAARLGFDGHDTVEVMERFSDVRIAGVPGDPGNLKVTYPGDLAAVRELRSGPSRTGPR